MNNNLIFKEYITNKYLDNLLEYNFTNVFKVEFLGKNEKALLDILLVILVSNLFKVRFLSDILSFLLIFSKGFNLDKLNFYIKLVLVFDL